MTADLLGPALLDRLPRRCSAPATTAPPSAPAWPISASAPFTAPIRPNTPTTCSPAASTAGASSASTSAPLPRRHASAARTASTPASAAPATRVEARVIGSILRTVDSQAGPDPALAVLADPAIDVVTMTVTEKAYCHRPADGALDPGPPRHPPRPRAPRGAAQPARPHPARARPPPQTHRRPITLISCDNIPGNGAILAGVVRALAETRRGLADWIAANAAFPSTMVDRIAPATTPADLDTVEQRFGYRDAAVAVGEPFRQWVIETRFAGRIPPLGSRRRHLRRRRHPLRAPEDAHPQRRADHPRQPRRPGRPRAHLRRRRRPAARRLHPPHADVRKAFRPSPRSRASRRSPMSSRASTGCATPRSATAATRSPPTARRRSSSACSTPPPSGCAAASPSPTCRSPSRPASPTSSAPQTGSAAPGAPTTPQAGRVAAIADRIGRDPKALTAEILAIDAIFPPALAADTSFRAAVARALDGLLSDHPMAYLRDLLATPHPMGATT